MVASAVYRTSEAFGIDIYTSSWQAPHKKRNNTKNTHTEKKNAKVKVFSVRSGVWTRDLLHPKQESYH